jgi:GNAT superfamily N-acetyltransferase
MDYTIRTLTHEDEPILWEMLQYAAHESSIESVRQQPCLTRYVQGWGRMGDVGYVAMVNGIALAAAWLRLGSGEDKRFGYVRDDIPELAIAVAPHDRGQGIGTQLLIQVLELAKNHFPAVSLSVRADNAAVRLYKRVGFVRVPGSEVINRTGDVSFNMIYEF